MMMRQASSGNASRARTKAASSAIAFVVWVKPSLCGICWKRAKIGIDMMSHLSMLVEGCCNIMKEAAVFVML